MFNGQSLRLIRLDDGFVELCFDRTGEAINKFDRRTTAELRDAARLLAALPDVRGVLVTSAKEPFIVGADITEFTSLFRLSAEAIADDVAVSNAAFVAFEDLAVPCVVAINGYALGGGLELALCATLRVMADSAMVGLPEVKLGLFPGFGGTVRMSRAVGLSTTMDWVTDGQPRKAAQALADGVVDRVCALSDLRREALTLLREAADGQIDWRARQQAKRAPVADAAPAQDERAARARERAASLLARHQPAAQMALEAMDQGAALDRTAALRLENDYFGRVARTQAAGALVQTFLSEQALKRIARKTSQGALLVREAAVLGAGIMGGGIAQTSARGGVPVRLKDVSEAALAKACEDAARQYGRQVKSGRLKQEKADVMLAAITPQADDAGFDCVDIVVEAIVEKLEVKHAVLAALEAKVRPDAIIASNTSSLRIDDIARPLLRPRQLVGMHFFNPVPAMQLVEVIRGSQTSESAVATAVAYASTMGKTPVVVKDCPGFLVNRVLMAYLGAAIRLISEGVDYLQIDRVMEAFGWPMGPSYLQDVIGIDTGSHVADVIALGYPQRMPPIEGDALKLMLGRGRLGQKSGVGFYRYERDAGGKLVKHVAEDTATLLATVQANGPRSVGDDHIVDRLMLAFVVEAACALDEGVAGTPGEVDQSLLLALGCPAYTGGALKYADWMGLPEVVRRCDALRVHGPMYEPTARMRRLAAEGGTFY